MNFLRYLLLPVSLLYALVLHLRHWLFDVGILASQGHFGVPVICIGNLNLGGTGKTPFTEYLINKLSSEHNIGVVSRGYGRKTKGYVAATLESKPAEIGDEPLQIYRKFHHTIQLAVCEDRITGINRILTDFPSIDLIVLDDAFQHRKVKADINILLTPYKHPFYKDFLLPVGTLRDLKQAAKRADLLVFTKSPEPISVEHLVEARNKVPANLKTNFAYSKINYSQFEQPFTGERFADCPEQVVLVTGIARPEYISDYLKLHWPGLSTAGNLHSYEQADHHDYTPADLDKIAKIFDTFAAAKKGIITTEKDWVKLAPLVQRSNLKPFWLVLPIRFEMDNESVFLSRLKHKLAAVAVHANDEYLR